MWDNPTPLQAFSIFYKNRRNCVFHLNKENKQDFFDKLDLSKRAKPF